MSRPLVLFQSIAADGTATSANQTDKIAVVIIEQLRALVCMLVSHFMRYPCDFPVRPLSMQLRLLPPLDLTQVISILASTIIKLPLL